MQIGKHLRIGALALSLSCWSCGTADQPSGETKPDAEAATPAYPSSAKVSVHEQFLEDLALERHASDGGGSVRLVLATGEDGSVQAGGYGRWTFEYTAGPLGIAEGGALLMLSPPFWGWSTPQVERRDMPGFTTLESSAEGVDLTPSTVDRNLFLIEIGGRPLAAGETLRLVFGASEALARADDYAEDNSAFYFKVDGDGDGVSGLVDDRPAVVVYPAAPARLTATLASTARPGAQVRLTVAVLDSMANLAHGTGGRLTFESLPEGLLCPASVAFPGSPGSPNKLMGDLQVMLRAPQPGTFRVRVHYQNEGFEAQALSNPVRVGRGVFPVFWGDLHGHSGFSDGTGTPKDYFTYARDVAGLDFAVLTDHDHFGVRFLDATPEIWDEIVEQTLQFNEPGRFLTLQGYEWTSWLYGHRHVLYFEDGGKVLTSVGANTTTPSELWAALKGQAALTIAHHSAGGPVATDWSFRPDPWMEPVTEIMSVHGSSEASDSPSPIYNALQGNFVRDQLDNGLRFGFIGSGDSHDGHPGHAHLSPKAGYRKARPDPRGRRAEQRMGNGGLAAVRVKHLTRLSLLGALRSRSTYATSGPRIWLETSLKGLPMGATLAACDSASLSVDFAGTSNVEYVEIIQRNKPIERMPFTQTMDAHFEHPISGLSTGDYLYVRLLQNDGALAWSSPYYVD